MWTRTLDHRYPERTRRVTSLALISIYKARLSVSCISASYHHLLSHPHPRYSKHSTRYFYLSPTRSTLQRSMRTSIVYVVSCFFGLVVALPVSERPSHTLANYAYAVDVRALPSIKPYADTMVFDKGGDEVRHDEATTATHEQAAAPESSDALGDEKVEEDAENTQSRRDILDSPEDSTSSSSSLPQSKRNGCSSRHRREDIILRQLPSLPAGLPASTPSLSAPVPKLPVPRELASSYMQPSEPQSETDEVESDTDLLKRQAPAPTTQSPSSTPSTSAGTQNSPSNPQSTSSTADAKASLPLLDSVSGAKPKREIRNKDFAAGFPPSPTWSPSASSSSDAENSSLEQRSSAKANNAVKLPALANPAA